MSCGSFANGSGIENSEKGQSLIKKKSHLCYLCGHPFICFIYFIIQLTPGMLYMYIAENVTAMLSIGHPTMGREQERELQEADHI